MKKTPFALLAALAFTCLPSCGINARAVITIGTMAQPGQPILEHIEAQFEEETNYDLQIQVYTDFATPNNALANAEIDANLFQHQPYLDTYNEANGTDLTAACIMYDCAYGGYSKKVSKLSDIPEGAKVSVANDGSNMKRCLDILAAEGLITVDYGETAAKDLNPDTVNNYIKTNEKNLVIAPMNTNMIAESLKDNDVYLGIVNATFAIAAGLGSDSSCHLLCQETDPTHKNANIVAVRPSDKDQDWCKKLVEILTSAATDKYVTDTFGSTITPYHG